MTHRLPRYLQLASVLGLGILLGLLLWNLISLPYHNPMNVYGALAKSQVNHNTNTVRYLAFLSSVAIVLLLATSQTTLRRRLFMNDSENLTIGAGQEFGSIRPTYAFLVVALLFIASHYALLSPDSTNQVMMDHYHQGDATATAIAAENHYVPYRDYFPSRGMAVDVGKVQAAFALFGRSQSSVIIIDAVMLSLTFVALGGLALLMFSGNYLASLLYGILFMGCTVLGFFAPSRLSERDLPYVLFLVFVFLLTKFGRPAVACFAVLAMCSLAPLSFVISVDRGLIMTAMLVIVWPSIFFTFFCGVDFRTKFLVSSLAGVLLGIAVLGWSIDWNWGDFARFAFQLLPAYREYVEGLEFQLSLDHFRGSVYRVYALALQALAVFWMLFRFLQHAHSSPDSLSAKITTFLRNNMFELSFALLSVAAFRYALGRADRHHIAGGGSWNMLFLLYMFVAHCVPRIAQNPRGKKALIAVMLAIGVGSTTVYAYHLFIQGTVVNAYPIGISDREMLTQEYQQVVDFLAPRLGDQTLFATLTNEGSWYYLLDQPSPLLFPEIWYGSTDNYQTTMISQLRDKPIVYLLYSNDAVWGRIDDIHVRDRVPALFKYVEENFEPFHRIGSQEIWIRKSAEVSIPN
jgi:hypothetical protein